MFASYYSTVSEEVCNSALLCEDDALHIAGIGAIAQYHSWLDNFWEKGIAYFLRDLKLTELDDLLSQRHTTERSNRIATLATQINALNSNITKWEQCRFESTPAPAAPSL